MAQGAGNEAAAAVGSVWLLRRSQERSVQPKPVSFSTVPAVDTLHFRHLWRNRCRLHKRRCSNSHRASRQWRWNISARKGVSHITVSPSVAHGQHAIGPAKWRLVLRGHRGGGAAWPTKWVGGLGISVTRSASTLA